MNHINAQRLLAQISKYLNIRVEESLEQQRNGNTCQTCNYHLISKHHNLASLWQECWRLLSLPEKASDEKQEKDYPPPPVIYLPNTSYFFI